VSTTHRAARTARRTRLPPRVLAPEVCSRTRILTAIRAALSPCLPHPYPPIRPASSTCREGLSTP
jgi:hypothetical protein